jgi:hypothetical protein
MKTGQHQTPEETELERKKADLAVLESELVDRELELATLRGELAAFQRRYLRVVGASYAELDELESQIAEIEVRKKPHNKEARERAATGREQARESARIAAGIENQANERGFVASEDLKKLYREVAKAVHPDLGSDDEDRARRHRFMAEANEAYEAGDENRLRAILREWESSPEAVVGAGVAAEIVRVIRKVAQVRERLVVVKEEIKQTRKSDLYVLRTKVTEAQQLGRNLLVEMAARVNDQIEMARANLARARQEVIPHHG